MGTKKPLKLNNKIKIQKHKYLTLNLQKTCKIKSIWKKKENKKRNKKACQKFHHSCRKLKIYISIRLKHKITMQNSNKIFKD